jgi:hypothetical protein
MPNTQNLRGSKTIHENPKQRLAPSQLKSPPQSTKTPTPRAPATNPPTTCTTAPALAFAPPVLEATGGRGVVYTTTVRDGMFRVGVNNDVDFGAVVVDTFARGMVIGEITGPGPVGRPTGPVVEGWVSVCVIVIVVISTPEVVGEDVLSPLVPGTVPIETS